MHGDMKPTIVQPKMVSGNQTGMQLFSSVVLMASLKYNMD